jgi:hypothetical protein
MDIVEAGNLLRQIQLHFKHINEDRSLTEADKKQVKDFYLQNFIAPKARRILEEEIAKEEARKERMNRARMSRPSAPDR